jgi:hypothetical protein
VIENSGWDRNCTQVFVSHCAPDDAATAAVAPAKLTVAQLKSALKGRGLNTVGAKPALVARLEVVDANIVTLHVLRMLKTLACTHHGARVAWFNFELSAMQTWTRVCESTSSFSLRCMQAALAVDETAAAMDGASGELKLEVKDEGAEPTEAAEVDAAAAAVHTPAAQARQRRNARADFSVAADEADADSNEWWTSQRLQRNANHRSLS